MPSDERGARALQALAGPRESYRSAVIQAVEEVRGFLALRAAPATPASERAARELGSFAAGRIDAERFASLLGTPGTLAPELRTEVERALGMLEAIAHAGEALLHLALAPGAELHREVRAALARVGGAFAAAQLVERVRTGRYRPGGDDVAVGPFPFRRWNRAERQIAPPLVIELEGADLCAGGLEEFLDGAQKIVLVARGKAPPAPLARLITPGVFVMQATDAAELDRLAHLPGPAIAALLPEGAARFVHDPLGGPSLRQRLQVWHLPAPEENGGSTFRANEELAQLATLRDAAERAPAPPAAQGGPAAGDPVEALAGWLLRQVEP